MRSLPGMTAPSRLPAVNLGASAVAAAGVGLAGLGLLIARRLTAANGRRYDLTIRGVDNSGERPIIVLDRMPRTAARGSYSLVVESGERVRLSPEVHDLGPGLVGREVVGEGCDGLAAGARAAWSGILFMTPADAGMEAANVEVATDVGPAPAWIIPPPGEPSTTWVIHIHGLGGTRAGMLRGVQVAVDAGLTSLVPTYRNDGEGPVVGTGRSELGAAEVDDVRAAVRFALDRGATSIILFGWSMGAAIALQLAAEPEFRSVIAGLVLESPVLDWVATIKANCARAGIPAWMGALAIPWLDIPPLASITGLGGPVGLRRFNWIARADELSVPTLILHGTADTSSPFEHSTRLQELRPDIVELEGFEADHTMSWNAEAERWEDSLSSWLRRVPVTGDITGGT